MKDDKRIETSCTLPVMVGATPMMLHSRVAHGTFNSGSEFELWQGISGEIAAVNMKTHKAAFFGTSAWADVLLALVEDGESSLESPEEAGK